MLAISRQAQPKIQCLIPTPTDNMSRVIQDANDIES